MIFFKLPLIILLYFMCLNLSSCRYLDGGLIFLRSSDCMKAIRSKRADCTLSYEDIKISLRFEPTPAKKGEPYELYLMSESIKSAKAELIGLSMEMPKVRFDFSEQQQYPLAVRISPGLCSETKMNWRLKITMVSEKEETYYTFIDYQIGR